MENRRKKSLMQRLQSWFEGLPLGRTNKERRSRKTSHSAAPTCRTSDSKPITFHRQPSFLEPKKNRGKPVAIKQPIAPIIYADASLWNNTQIPKNHPRMGESMSQSYTQRSKIRTNPWIQRDQDSRRFLRNNEMMMTSSNASFASMDRSHMRVKSFGESICSSGYGSQDSSPESSVHSPNWQSARESADKAVECRSIDVDEALGYLEGNPSFSPYDNLHHHQSSEHIYHELESLTRISKLLEDSVYLSDSECPSGSSRDSFSPPSSPIYARPYEGSMAGPYQEDYFLNHSNHSNHGNPFQKSRNLNSLPRSNADLEPIYATVKPIRPRVLSIIPQPSSCGALPRPLPPLIRPIPIRLIDRPAPQFQAPPPPPINLDDELERAENEFLAELDAQIAELQMKSDAVRSMVEEARGRRNRNPNGSEISDSWCRARWHQNPRFELRL